MTKKIILNQMKTDDDYGTKVYRKATSQILCRYFTFLYFHFKNPTKPDMK